MPADERTAAAIPDDCCPICTKDLESDGWCFECRAYPRKDRPAATVEYEIVKMGYSVRPWRIVETQCQAGERCRRPNGCRACEVYTSEPFDHPNLGRIVIPGPLSFDRKRDAVAALAVMEADLAH